MKVTIPQIPFMQRVWSIVLKTVGILLALYFFICSLTFLSTAFRILGGRNLSSFFSNSELLSNPLVGVMIGILVTVLVQSSSTSTSIIVALVSAGVEVKHAIPMIFGSNVGTSVTNTIVSMTQVADREAFRRAFAAATVHDMFNWLTVVVMLILEASTGFMELMTGLLVDHMPLNANVSSPDLLRPLTGPLTDIIVQLDKNVLMGWSFNIPEYANVTTLLKTKCNEDGSPCHFLLALLGKEGLDLSDVWLGLLLLGFSLALLCGCLIALMKILNSIMGSQMAGIIKKTINAEIPYVPWLTGYLNMLVGAVITILVRSSSVFTSTLTPLCGTGLVSLETAYPMTLGSNIGTTTTSILASFAAEGKYLKPSIQIALVHLFFNVFGILIFYPIPFMRWPIPMAKKLGDITAQYRWFAALYLIVFFFLLPTMVFLLSLGGPIVLYSVSGPFIILLFLSILINVLQSHTPNWLPPVIRNWNFLPLWMRSLEPFDQFLTQFACCSKYHLAQTEAEDPEPGNIQHEATEMSIIRPINKSNGSEAVFLLANQSEADFSSVIEKETEKY